MMFLCRDCVRIRVEGFPHDFPIDNWEICEDCGLEGTCYDVPEIALSSCPHGGEEELCQKTDRR